MKRFAFTLAEVLITLGIIGVVAAMTLPVLIENHQKKVVASKLAKFYSIMSQAAYSWADEEGISQGATYSFPEGVVRNGKELEAWYNDNLGKYIKSTNQNSTSSGFFVALADGSGFNAYANLSEIHFFYCIDVKYCNMEANQLEGTFDGRHTFLFDFEDGKFYTSQKNDNNKTRAQLLDSCKYGNKDNSEVSSPGRRHACTRLIQIDGWQISKDYPWQQIMLEQNK